VEGPWPLEYAGWQGAEPDEGEWTCAPWGELNVQVPFDSSIHSFSIDVSTTVTQVVVDALHFDGGSSAWRVEQWERSTYRSACSSPLGGRLGVLRGRTACS
jgi:hypothetical protein